MIIFLTVLIMIACAVLAFFILIQNPKGGGIAANFIAPQQIMGAKRSTDVVEKATWVLAVILISFSLLSNFFRPTTGETEAITKESKIKENTENAQVPTAPAQQPQPAQQQNQPAAGAQPQQK